MSATPHPSYSPGWYADPHAPEYQERYFDGAVWTDARRPLQQTPPVEGPVGGVVTAGYIFAVLMPIVGFILGIVALTRPAKATSRHGIPIVVVSVIAFIIWYAIISAAQSTYSY